MSVCSGPCIAVQRQLMEGCVPVAEVFLPYCGPSRVLQSSTADKAQGSCKACHRLIAILECGQALSPRPRTHIGSQMRNAPSALGCALPCMKWMWYDLQAAILRCSLLRRLELLTHASWKVDSPCPIKSRETIISHLLKQMPDLKVSSAAVPMIVDIVRISGVAALKA